MIKLSTLDGDELHLVIPLTPSGNKILAWAWVKSPALTRYKKRCATSVMAAVNHAMGYVPSMVGRQWAKSATISIVRCSNSRKAIDDDNVVIGCKYARDALVTSGVVVDDNPGRLCMQFPVEDRKKPNWGTLHGPATHLIIRREL